MSYDNLQKVVKNIEGFCDEIIKKILITFQDDSYMSTLNDIPTLL